MATYAAADDLNAYLAADRSARRNLRGIDDDGIERMLQRGERAVDLVLGPTYPRDLVTGLKLDPATLTQAQRDALSRAVCAYVEWVLLVSTAVEAGDSIEAPVNLAIVQPAARQPPKMVAELAGYGLLKRSATVIPDPPVPLDEFAPCQVWSP